MTGVHGEKEVRRCEGAPSTSEAARSAALRVVHARLPGLSVDPESISIFEVSSTAARGSVGPDDCVVARLDQRDVMLLKRPLCHDAPLRLVAPSPRCTTTLIDFLTAALPVQGVRITIDIREGDAAAMILNWPDRCDGLIIPKWLLDVLVRPHAGNDEICAALESLTRIILPLSAAPTPPGQGVLVVRAAAAELRSKLAPAHSPTTAALAMRELEAFDGAPRLSILHRSCGDIVFERRGESGSAVRPRIEPPPALPKARSRAAIWPSPAGDDGLFTREPLPTDAVVIASAHGIIVSKAEALPADAVIPATTPVFVPGTATWRKLAERGVLVNGSFDGLGEREREELAALFPGIEAWLKFSHRDGFEDPAVAMVPTYRLVPLGSPPDVRGCTHFYWRSGSQFEYILGANPHLRSAWHGCGPGHTADVIRRYVDDPSHIGTFLSFEDFAAAVQ